MNLIKRLFVTMGIFIGLLAMGSQASAGVIYSTDFEGGSVGAEWSAGSLVTSWDGSPSTTYLGNFRLAESTTLTLTGIGPHTDILLDFDLYLFYTWDGEGNGCCGPDGFGLSGAVSFYETFSNHQLQSYSGTADECYSGAGAVSCGIANAGRTDFYRSLGPTGSDTGFLFSHTGSTLSITFYGSTTQTDEWWGIDNVTISTVGSSSVPEPAGIVLLGLGLLGISMRRTKH